MSFLHHSLILFDVRHIPFPCEDLKLPGLESYSDMRNVEDFLDLVRQNIFLTTSQYFQSKYPIFHHIGDLQGKNLPTVLTSDILPFIFRSLELTVLRRLSGPLCGT